MGVAFFIQSDTIFPIVAKRHPRATLHRERARRDWTLGELSAALGRMGAPVSISFLHNIEQGAAEPRELRLVLALDELLGIPAETWPNFRDLSRFLEMRRSA